ncbi:glycosyltransferase family 4 protein [Acaryochloris marina]|uniref:Glycosyl transferase, group 1 family protein, putative n=1 Tax=Acaryochloris marina (strain MBIC 11017) TaxID=329726 RepID=B0C398_ACAM1|nr:glycosyltransferase family 4 protein [Acaryochloris marina]ABW28597.1 glycosyl transferase, group 1 family protein, putative [Acaryochloris marina MBIC11017]BDM77595.1 glycosyltransferase WbuB [Acaryochloris marina MBIC10699]
MNRVVVLTELFYPERTSTAYFLTAIAQGLVTDYPVIVFTDASLYESQASSLASYVVVKGVEIHRCSGTAFDKNWLPGRLVNGCTRAIAIFLQALWQCHASDVVLVVTNPPLLPFMAWLLKTLKGCEFVLLVHDVYPEVLSATGLVHNHSLVYRLVQRGNRLVYAQASRIITLGRDMQKLVGQKFTQPVEGKLVCIPNWAETEMIYPVDKQDSTLLQRLKLVDKFVVLYAGNMGRTHDLNILLDAANILTKTHPQIHFLLIGAGARKPEVEARVQEQKLQNVTVLPYLPHEEKNVALNSCDVGVISFVPGMAGVSVPSRMYNQMAAGKPLIAIADHESELAKVIQEEGIGWLVSPHDGDQLVKLLTQIVNDSELCNDMGHKAAQAVLCKYQLKHAVSKYQSLFRELIPKTTSLAQETLKK